MNKTYKELTLRMKEAAAIGSASGVVGWDQETMMPSGACEARADQLAALAGVIHEKVTDKGAGRMLVRLSRNPAGLSPAEKACVREWLKDYRRATKVPPNLVRELARVTSLAQSAWIKARKASDFASFAPWLKRIFLLKRREAEAIGYKGHPYDALLDAYEPGMTVALLDPIIDELKKGMVPITKALLKSKKGPDDSILRHRYPEPLQEELCREMAKTLGVDPETSRLDRSAHPFCCGIAPTDVRITTRYQERWLPAALYGVIHESGHALYEQGLPVKHMGTPLAEAVSLGIHESQSRLWENMIGRSRAFARFLHPMLRKRFRKNMSGTTPDDLYLALNRVKATPIRVEADEVTYNLHIVLRYELEKKLMTGKIGVEELPSLWRGGMRELLGISPADDAEGVLQDTHWAQGLVGYFPTYLLGNLCAAQLWGRMRSEIRGLDRMIASGRFNAALSWLRKKIHCHGRRFEPADLVRMATGRPLSPASFLEHLRGKYGGIYGIEL